MGALSLHPEQEGEVPPGRLAATAALSPPPRQEDFLARLDSPGGGITLGLPGELFGY